MFNALMNAFKTFFLYILHLLESFGDTVLGWIMALLPSPSLTGGNSSIAFALSACNNWAPLDDVIAAAGLFIVFVIIFMMIKVIIKLF